MKYLKYLIIFFSIIVTIILISLTIIKINSNSGDDDAISNNTFTQNNITEIEIPEDDTYEIKNNISKRLTFVENRSNYFIIKNIFDKYVNIIGEEENNVLNNMLSTQFKNQYGTYDSVNVPKLTNSSQYYRTTINEMLVTQIDNTNYVYIVKANCRVVNMDNSIFTITLMIEIDTVNELYYIYPEKYVNDNRYNNLKSGDTINFSVEPINNNVANKYNKITKTDSEMAEEYFNDYKELLKYNQNEAYQKLNSNYAKSRFGSKDSFNKYLENNKSNIALMKINQYKLYNSDNYTDYICTDQYNNYYIFRQQNGIMRYTVFLDTYTIELDIFKEEYNNSKDDESKLSIQLGKITQMLNNKDYNAIYNKLNETFRNNNYTNVSSLEEYLKNNIYNINSIVINEYEKNDDYYVCKATIQNQKNTNESKDINLIIKLIDSNNFEMSFSFEE